MASIKQIVAETELPTRVPSGDLPLGLPSGRGLSFTLPSGRGITAPSLPRPDVETAGHEARAIGQSGEALFKLSVAGLDTLGAIQKKKREAREALEVTTLYTHAVNDLDALSGEAEKVHLRALSDPVGGHRALGQHVPTVAKVMSQINTQYLKIGSSETVKTAFAAKFLTAAAAALSKARDFETKGELSFQIARTKDALEGLERRLVGEYREGLSRTLTGANPWPHSGEVVKILDPGGEMEVLLAQAALLLPPDHAQKLRQSARERMDYLRAREAADLDPTGFANGEYKFKNLDPALEQTILRRAGERSLQLHTQAEKGYQDFLTFRRAEAKRIQDEGLGEHLKLFQDLQGKRASPQDYRRQYALFRADERLMDRADAQYLMVEKLLRTPFEEGIDDPATLQRVQIEAETGMSVDRHPISGTEYFYALANRGLLKPATAVALANTFQQNLQANDVSRDVLFQEGLSFLKTAFGSLLPSILGPINPTTFAQNAVIARAEANYRTRARELWQQSLQNRTKFQALAEEVHKTFAPEFLRAGGAMATPAKPLTTK